MASRRIPAFLWPNLLSLDAPIVAVSWCALLAQCHQISLPKAALPVLFGAVWCIYVVDRVIDGLACKGDPSLLTARHAFYRRHRWPFLTAALLVGSLCLWAAGHALPQGMAVVGVGISLLVLLYLLKIAGAHWPPAKLFATSLLAIIAGILAVLIGLPTWLKAAYAILLAGLIFLIVSRPKEVARTHTFFPKELLCGVLFAIGTFLPPQFYLHGGPLSVFAEPLTYGFGALCVLNCCAIAIYEEPHDAKHDPGAITQRWPAVSRIYPFLLLATVGFTASHLSPEMGMRLTQPLTVSILLSLILLFLLHQFGAKRLTLPALRVAADLALLTPLLFLFRP